MTTQFLILVPLALELRLRAVALHAEWLKFLLQVTVRDASDVIQLQAAAAAAVRAAIPVRLQELRLRLAIEGGSLPRGPHQ